MIVTAVCDSCLRPLLRGVTNLQIQPGDIVTTQVGLQMRSTHSPEIYNLCASCMTVVRQAVDRLREQRLSLQAPERLAS